MATLFRPVGFNEISLLWDAEFREFPRRLPHQSIFYPVKNLEYARRIAADWNVHDEPSGFSGYVTRFDVNDEYLSRFEPHVVGARTHVEYGIPATQLADLNRAITGGIKVEEAFFGPRFVGFIPQLFGLKGKKASEQFVILVRSWDYSRVDFSMDIYANQKAVFLNSWFWAQHDSTANGVNSDVKQYTFARIGHEWEHYKMAIPLPSAFKEYS